MFGVGGDDGCLALRGAWAGAFSAVQTAATVRHGGGAAGVAGAVFRAAARCEVGVAARVAVAQRAGAQRANGALGGWDWRSRGGCAGEGQVLRGVGSAHLVATRAGAPAPGC